MSRRITELLEGPPGIYAGIGSRKAPPKVLEHCRKLGAEFAKRGWTLRSGGADGCDTAWLEGQMTGILALLCGLLENACEATRDDIRSRYEVYLPWSGFRPGDWTGRAPRLKEASKDGWMIAAQHHPSWASMRSYVQALHARNTHQVLGADCRTPARVVICWTSDGADGSPERPTTPKTGGTGQAIRIARAYGVPVINLAQVEP